MTSNILVNHIIYSTPHNCDDCDSKFVFMYKSVPAHMVLIPPSHNAWTINTGYPWISPTCIESRSKYSDTYILNQRCMIISRKASIGMYSGYDKLSWLHCNLVCVLFDPAIITSSFNFIQLFFILVYEAIHYSCSLIIKINYMLMQNDVILLL